MSEDYPDIKFIKIDVDEVQGIAACNRGSTQIVVYTTANQLRGLLTDRPTKGRHIQTIYVAF